ncbi:MAG: hypothetical protein K8R56_04595 [Candidatus Eisenbacteria bacterium]|nr:hypothetical protein [Candidatus Eisenbacteria bacterium]
MLTRALLLAGLLLVTLQSSTAWAAAAADSLHTQAAFPAPQVRAWQVGLLRPDRLEHASLSFTLAGALLIATRDRPAAGAVTLAAGLGKELWDRRGPSGFDGIDLVADATGIALALTLIRARGD